MLKNPWMFEVSDQELTRERKLTSSSLDYLYVLVEGSLTRGAFAAVLDFSSGESFKSGAGEGDVDRLGEDMWWRQSLTAIPIGRDKIDQILEGRLHGGLRFIRTSTLRKPDLGLSQIKFYRLKESEAGYVAEEISAKLAQLNCYADYQVGLESTCVF